MLWFSSNLHLPSPRADFRVDAEGVQSQGLYLKEIGPGGGGRGATPGIQRVSSPAPT